MSNLKFAYLTEKFYAVAYGQTGSNEFMSKLNRPYLGVVDRSGWFVPLRANINAKAPSETYYLTPFETDNPHFKNPGLDFQKAVFLDLTDDTMFSYIDPPIPQTQFDFINRHLEDLETEFEKFVLNIETYPKDSRMYRFSTVPFFPEGIERIKALQIEKEQEMTEQEPLNRRDTIETLEQEISKLELDREGSGSWEETLKICEAIDALKLKLVAESEQQMNKEKQAIPMMPEAEIAKIDTALNDWASKITITDGERYKAYRGAGKLFGAEVKLPDYEPFLVPLGEQNGFYPTLLLDDNELSQNLKANIFEVVRDNLGYNQAYYTDYETAEALLAHETFELSNDDVLGIVAPHAYDLSDKHWDEIEVTAETPQKSHKTKELDDELEM